MSNSTPENDLVAAFCAFLMQPRDFAFRIISLHNGGSDTNEFADIEYTSSESGLIAIEAKTHDTSNAPNTVHMVFGQLLREHGKTNPERERNPASFGILIPAETPTSINAPNEAGVNYYQRRFRNIPRDKFFKFGTLVNARYVFVFKRTQPLLLEIYSWEGFYDKDAPLYSVA